MKLTLPLGTIINGGFAAAFNALRKIELAPKDAYAIARCAREMQTAADDYMKARNAAVKRHGALVVDDRETVGDKPNPNKGKPYSPERFRVLPENEATFHAEMTALCQTSVELFLNHKITLPADARISAADIAALEPILDIDPIAPPSAPQ
jgi:hypothetical protein